MKISMRLGRKINNKNVKIEIRNFIIVFFFGNQIMNYYNISSYRVFAFPKIWT